MKRKTDFLYLKLAGIIREHIQSGVLKPGDFLLSENELALRYGLSRISVRKSLNTLVDEGLIVKKPGLGSIVSAIVPQEERRRKTLRIVTTSPSHYADYALGMIIEAFEKEHPHTDVKLLQLSAVDFWKSVHALRESGPYPDLLLITDRQYRELERKEEYTDLSDIVQHTKKLFYPKLLDSLTGSSGLQALPVTFSPVFVAYNPSLFDKYGIAPPNLYQHDDEAPESLLELSEDTNGDGIPDLYALSLSHTYNRWPVIALQNGVDFKRLREHAAELRATLNLLHDMLYRKRTAILHTRNKNSRNIEPFATEHAAMMLTTAMELAALKEESLPFEPQAAPVRFGPKQATLLVANVFVMPAASPEPELAAAFCKVAIRSDVQERIGRAVGFLSVLRGINDSVWGKTHLQAIQLGDARLDRCFFVHEVFPDSAFIGEMDYELGLFWAGLETAEAAAERLLRIQTDETR
ncbi:extracellular solute-binding protein [Paenibacillus hodogayensis]|uniref:Extracellular solute-binding protein n=1 Tax=Paenibacillus hodogayensis TaxID=279208 RepID=A0ABV5VYA4_9BACL